MELSPLSLDFKFDPRRTHVESVTELVDPPRFYPGGVCGGVQLGKSEPSESASDPRGAEADSSPPVGSPYLNSSSYFNFSGSFIPLPPVPNLLYSSSTFIVHLKYFLPLDLFLSLHLMYSINICPSYID